MVRFLYKIHVLIKNEKNMYPINDFLNSNTGGVTI